MKTEEEEEQEEEGKRRELSFSWEYVTFLTQRPTGAASSSRVMRMWRVGMDKNQGTFTTGSERVQTTN